MELHVINISNTEYRLIREGKRNYIIQKSSCDNDITIQPNDLIHFVISTDNSKRIIAPTNVFEVTHVELINIDKYRGEYGAIVSFKNIRN